MNQVSVSHDVVEANRLRDMPVSFFATVMGLSGLTIAAHKVETALGWQNGASLSLLAASGAVFAVLAFFYVHKILVHGHAVAEEWAHPVRISFFPTISIALILLATAALPVHVGLSKALWVAGAALHMTLTLLVMTSWINHSRYEVIHTNPAWFIPVVGNIIVPIAGITHAPADLSWFFFSVGLLFWLVLLTIVLYRLIFHNPLPGRLVPTMFILLAPPSVGFVAWTVLSGTVDPFGRILYFSAAFMFLLMLPQLPKFSRLSFTLSWWAYSFPLAAFTIATLVMAERTHAPFYHWAGLTLFWVLSAVIAGLSVRTAIAIVRHEICRPES